MSSTNWLHDEAQIALERLLPRITPLFADKNILYAQFLARAQRHFPLAFENLYKVYSGRYDFFYHLEQILLTTAQKFILRSKDLHTLDEQREATPTWFNQPNIVGGVCYVDLFADNLAGLRKKIPYFKELGLTYLHLMPLYAVPEKNSDGGYAVSNFREVNPALGTMDELTRLAMELRNNGISLVMDFVFNHTSDEHAWAKRALAGEKRYQNYYYFYPDRSLPNRYEKTLREIFPEQAPGNFTYIEPLDRWAWTTFNTLQWDLNYTNPEVFNAMLSEMLFLANIGTEVLRLDAVAFVWKQMDTTCENLPEVHHIIRAFNALVQIAAPAMVFKSEAIVHPDDVVSYISPEECQISYNPTYMALLWEALATREVKLLRHSMSKRFDLPTGTAWINYVRVHDDIGWSFADEDAREVGIRGFDHRLFLNQFYTGKFSGSFASGVPFNYNPSNQDMRICGTTASLAGLERGLAGGNPLFSENALRRIILLHSLIISTGGIPLIYIGDEVGTLNDYSYEQDPHKKADSRWVHRPKFDWERADQRQDELNPVGRIFSALQGLIRIRKNHAAFSDPQTQFVDVQNGHVLGFIRNQSVFVLANFSEYAQTVSKAVLRAYWGQPDHIADLVSDTPPVEIGGDIRLEPYQFMWLVRP
ncbi:MAG: amylosucrase [Phototrophicales bacterium]|nr:amylosucrase [Phototrophicales bacterium]